MTLLSARLRAARQAMHPPITQKAVAQRVGLSPGAINLWESGKSEPSATHLRELARWYNVSTDYLLGVTDENKLRPTNAPDLPLYIAPVVEAQCLFDWNLNFPSELVQTHHKMAKGECAAVIVAGDAMNSCALRGDYAIVKKSTTIVPGCVVFARLKNSDTPTMRRCVIEGDSIMLFADDTRFPSYSMNDVQEILGIVVEVVRFNQLLS